MSFDQYPLFDKECTICSEGVITTQLSVSNVYLTWGEQTLDLDIYKGKLSPHIHIQNLTCCNELRGIIFILWTCAEMDR